MTGAHAQELLGRVGITANKNAVPYDERKPTVTSGLRLGTPAMTTRGFGADEMREVGRIILQALAPEHHRGRPRPAAGAQPRSDRGLPALPVAGRLMAGRERRPARPVWPPRPSWEDYFMQIAEVVSTRSSCLRRHVGAVLVKNRQILATGYNGVPRGIAHCEERGLPARPAGHPFRASGRSCAGGCTPSRTPSSRPPITGWPSTAPRCSSRSSPASPAPRLSSTRASWRCTSAASTPTNCPWRLFKEAGTRLVRMD